MHFSQGWVQFGYRFSNDFAPFAMILVTLGHRQAAASALREPWPRGALDRRQRLGRLLGRDPGVVSATLDRAVERPAGAGRHVLAFGLVAGLALLLYVPTLMPDVGTWDTAEFQAIGPVLGIAHPTGLPHLHAAGLARLGGAAALRQRGLPGQPALGAAHGWRQPRLLAVRLVQVTRRWPLGVLAGVRLRA